MERKAIKFDFTIIFKYICSMRKEQIENLIDKKIENSFSTGSTIYNVVTDLKERSKNIVKVLERDGFSFEDAQKMEWDKIEKVRVKYAVHYVKHASKRISDMDWLRKKHGILSISYYVIWKHLKFREMLLDSKPNLLTYFDKQRKSAKELTQEAIDKLQNKNWYSGKPKKVGQKLFRAFLRNDDKSIKMIELTDEELYLYEIDDNQLIKPKDIVIPYIKLSI